MCPYMYLGRQIRVSKCHSDFLLNDLVIALYFPRQSYDYETDLQKEERTHTYTLSPHFLCPSVWRGGRRRASSLSLSCAI